MDRSAPRRSQDGLDGGKSREIVFEDVRLKKGEHTLMGRVNTGDATAETDESDNTRAASVTCS